MELIAMCVVFPSFCSLREPIPCLLHNGLFVRFRLHYMPCGRA